MENNERKKPVCEMIGKNGNIFNLMAIAARTLREHDKSDEADEMYERIRGGEAKSYHHAIAIIMEYVDIV